MLKGLAAAWGGSINHVIRLENALQAKRLQAIGWRALCSPKAKVVGMRKAALKRGRLLVTDYLADFDPNALAPVAVTAARFAPAILLSFFPLPIVLLDAELQGRFVPRLAGDAPAVAFFIADNGG